MKSIIVVFLMVIVSVGAGAEPADQEACKCKCPTLRQHTWVTLKDAWAKGKHISREQWQEFSRWREQQRSKDGEM